MKTSSLILFLLVAGSVLLPAAQSPSNPARGGKPDQKDVPLPTPYRVIERGVNHKVWQRETYEKLSNGKIVPSIHKYTELATGMHYKDAKGQWVESKELIESFPQGAIARQGPYQVIFASNLNSAGAIDQLTPDGKRLRSNILGLAYYDSATKQSVFIAQIQDSTGEFVSANQVLYPNAFNGVKADVRYTYKKASFEQDVILREQPPAPESFGLNPDTTAIEVVTEFINPPEVKLQNRQANPNEQFDQDISWGAMGLGNGKAFDLGDSQIPNKQLPVKHQYLMIDGRQILLEIAPLKKLESNIKKLPMQSNAQTRYPMLASSKLNLPKALLANAEAAPIKLTNTMPSNKGYVLDYIELYTDDTDFTFLGARTYYISSWVNLGGVTTFEGGTVIKYDSSGSWLSLNIVGSLNCKTGPYQPAVFTSKDDDSVGDVISNSSGSPVMADFSSLIFYLSLNSATTLKYMRFCYASCAVTSYSYAGIGDTTEIWNSQFVNCSTAFWYCNPNLHNVLFTGCSSVIYVVAQSLTLNAEQVTADGDIVFSTGDYDCACHFTNSVVGNEAIAGDGEWFSVVSPIFQPTGAGGFYLTNNSPLHNIGTTNICPQLLAELANKTTYPPIVYTTTSTQADTNFAPQAQRDSIGNPDLGYHYDPLDYIFNGFQVVSNMTFSAGAAVGWHEDGDWPGYGLSLPNDISISFNGTASAPCHFARFNTVQEGNGSWTSQGWFGLAANGSWADPTNSPAINASFTVFTQMGSVQNPFRDFSSPLLFRGNSCEFYGAGNGGYDIAMYYTNCFFYLCFIAVQSGSPGFAALTLENCTVIGDFVMAGHWEGDEPYWPSMVHNCAFETVDFYIDDPFGVNTNYADYNFNAYLSGAPHLYPEGTDYLETTNFNWQTSWFGNYYLPTNSSLINAGSTMANYIGLYHFTTQTNQVKEANSVVDIGYHYVTTDAFGNVLDTDADGIPDYQEDSNGNGTFNVGDLSDWVISPYNGISSSNKLQVFTPLK